MAETKSKPLRGKVALVTGAGQNIGRAIALGLSKDGAFVMVNGRSNRDAIESVANAINDAGGGATRSRGVRCLTWKPREAAG